MASLYKCAASNYGEVEKALKQIERAVAEAIRRNDRTTISSLTRTQLLIASVKAEARLIKIIHMSNGMTPGERSVVLGQEKALDKWLTATDLAFRRHYKVNQHADLASVLDHDVLAKHATLTDLINNDVKLLIQLRNKLAHGQWLYPFDTTLTNVEAKAKTMLEAENTLTIRYRDRLISQVGNILVALVNSPSGFEKHFNQHFVKIRRYQGMLREDSFDAWADRIRATKAALSRIAPVNIKAI